MLDPHRLRVFRSVVSEGSVSGAAQALGYTSSAVSQHIAALQRETGLTLVERTGRGITTTEVGRQLADESKALFDQLAHLEGLVTDLRQGRAGRLAVGYFASAGVAWIPPIVATIAREFPSVRMDLRLTELIGDDDRWSPDLEIYVDGAASSSMHGHDAHPLLIEPYLAVVPSDSPWATRSEVTLRELSSEAWVDNDIARGPCRRAVLDACAAAGFAPDFTVETQDYPSALRFVAAGLGLTVVPRLACVDLPAGTVAVPIVDPTPTRDIRYRVRHGVTEHAALSRIVELLLAHTRHND